MESKPNELYLTISGKFPIESPLELDQEYSFTVTGDIVKLSDSSQQDGTYDRNYILKPTQVLPTES